LGWWGWRIKKTEDVSLARHVHVERKEQPAPVCYMTGTRETSTRVHTEDTSLSESTAKTRNATRPRRRAKPTAVIAAHHLLLTPPTAAHWT